MAKICSSMAVIICRGVVGGDLVDVGLWVADVSAGGTLEASADVGKWDVSSSCIGGTVMRLSLDCEQVVIELSGAR